MPGVLRRAADRRRGAPEPSNGSAGTTIAAPPDAIYPLLNDLSAGWTRWSPLMANQPGVVVEYGSATSGEGAGVTWSGRAGSGSLELTQCSLDTSVSYRTTMSMGGMVAVGKIELKRGGADTVVAWSDELSVGANPVWRWLAFAMDGIRTSNVNKGLAALKQVAEHDRAPAA